MRWLLLQLCNCLMALLPGLIGRWLFILKKSIMDQLEKRGEGLEISFSLKQRRRQPFKPGADLEGSVHLTIEESDGKEVVEVKVAFSTPK